MNNKTNSDWREDFKGAIKTTKELSEFLNTPITSSNQTLKGEFSQSVFIPQKLATRIREKGPNSVLWKQFVPSAEEEKPPIQNEGFLDPIGDQKNQKAPQIIHRYGNRALLLPTPFCPVACRYCFRKNELNVDQDLFKADLKKSFEYLKDHPEINEVILTGGDPLILSDEKLLALIEGLAGISSIKFLRIHTRAPIVMPSRITPDFLEVLSIAKRRFHKVLLAIHCNHTEEINQEVELALGQLATTEIELLSQTVLLKNINDNFQDLINLFEKLSHLKIRPYYLHHPDRVKGAMHFYLTQKEGSAIYKKLRKHLSGWMLPHYIVDGPEGQGKEPAYIS